MGVDDVDLVRNIAYLHEVDHFRFSTVDRVVSSSRRFLPKAACGTCRSVGALDGLIIDESGENCQPSEERIAIGLRAAAFDGVANRSSTTHSMRVLNGK